FFYFFFSSRRRHTRLQGDWSSDVCSSDLNTCTSLASTGTNNSSIHSGESDGSDVSLIIPVNPCYSPPPQGPNGSQPILTVSESRSEERRVGKECRCWWWEDH